MATAYSVTISGSIVSLGFNYSGVYFDEGGGIGRVGRSHGITHSSP